MNLKKLLDLFLTFARIGGLTFGGGYAMLPMLQKEVVENRGWATEEELADYFAIGQCTPGVIAVNTATFVGYREAGILGGVMATLGVIFPSLVIHPELCRSSGCETCFFRHPCMCLRVNFKCCIKAAEKLCCR